MNDIGMEELQYLTRQYRKLPNGQERMEAVRHAMQRADELKLWEYQLSARSELITQLVISGEYDKQLPVLSEYVAIFEEHPMEQYVTGYLDSLFRALYQWDYFPIPLEERTKIAESFFSACKRYYANLYEYYIAECEQYLHEGKTREAEECYQKATKEFDKYSYRQVISCRACKQADKVVYAIRKKDWETAIKEAEPILNGTIKCRQHPKETVHELLKFALDSGDVKKSKKYAALFEIFSKEDAKENKWALMRYYAFMDLEQGVEYFCKVLPSILSVRNQTKQKDFYKDSYVLWMQYAKKYETVSLDLPRNFSLYQEDGVYQTKELADWFYEQAIAIAKRFDARNGYPFYQNGIADMIEGMKKLENENW